MRREMEKEDVTRHWHVVDDKKDALVYIVL